MLSLLKSNLIQLLGTVSVALSVLFGAFWYGRKSQQEKERVEDMEDYIKIKKRIENVPDSPDRDAALERMRRNGWL